MNTIEIASAPTVPRNDEQNKLNWQSSLSIQRLLDVISSILAEEYLMIAKQNPEVFLNNTPRLSELRGCAPSRQGAST